MLLIFFTTHVVRLQVPCNFINIFSYNEFFVKFKEYGRSSNPTSDFENKKFANKQKQNVKEAIPLIVTYSAENSI